LVFKRLPLALATVSLTAMKREESRSIVPTVIVLIALPLVYLLSVAPVCEFLIS
jgi:hypothetical protein